MAKITDDFSVDPIAKTIRYNSNSSRSYTLRQFYLFLQDLFDEPEYMVYPSPIRRMSHNSYELINGFYLGDEETIGHLSGGELVAGQITYHIPEHPVEKKREELPLLNRWELILGDVDG